MTTSIRVTGLFLALCLVGPACRDDSPPPGGTGGTGGATGGTGGSGGRGGTGGGGRGGTGGTGGGATGGTGGGTVDAPVEMGGADTKADGADGSGDGTVEAGGDVPDTAPSEAGVDTTPADTAGDTALNNMSFFVSSSGSGAMGGNLGGLAGADAKCEALAAAEGAGGKGWRAFLSTEAGAITPAVNAKDRIGTGPWRNRRGQMIAASVTALIATPPAANLMIDERGNNVPNDWHEVLTGSQANGTAYVGRTCNSWTTNAAGSRAQSGIATDPDPGQRFSSHDSACTQAALEANGNQGRIYCFATTP